MTQKNRMTDTTSPSQRVIEQVAEATNTDPVDLEPLYTRIDPDCLDSIFSDQSSRASRARGQVSFPMAGCHVVVKADGTVDVSKQKGIEHTSPVSKDAASASSAAESPD